jgi:hypothetical protein
LADCAADDDPVPVRVAGFAPFPVGEIGVHTGGMRSEDPDPDPGADIGNSVLVLMGEPTEPWLDKAGIPAYLPADVCR